MVRVRYSRDRLKNVESPNSPFCIAKTNNELKWNKNKSQFQIFNLENVTFLQNNKGDIFSWKNVTRPKVTLFFDNEGDIFLEKNVTFSKGDILAPYLLIIKN